MIIYIQQSLKFIKQHKKMLRSGSKAVKAAGKAELLIENLKKHRKDFHSLGRLTKHGELRIKNCIKYDLGNGYRIILRIQKDHLDVMFIGTHAESDKWLETRKSLKEVCTGQTIKNACIANDPESSKTCRCNPHTNKEEEETSPLFLTEIEDKHLRQVFRGLCTNAALIGP